MSKKKQFRRPPGLTIDYSKLGVITIEEFKQALWTDLQLLKEEHHIRYLEAPKLRLELVNEFGETMPLRDRGSGKPIYRMHSRHYRPACIDYD